VTPGVGDIDANAVSVALQYGVPPKDLVNKFSQLRFEPASFTTNRDIPMAKSLVDYIFRYMASKFMSQDEKDAVGTAPRLQAARRRRRPRLRPIRLPQAAVRLRSQMRRDPVLRPLNHISKPASEVASTVGQKSPPSLLDGLKIVGATRRRRDREERLCAGQAPVVFDTADSPASHGLWFGHCPQRVVQQVHQLRRDQRLH
jgi:hypothetical protein